MYLHIGNNVVIKEKDIIGIFNLEKINEDNLFNRFIEKIKENSEIINISNGIEKSIILTKENEKNKLYISNISSITLSRRKNI